MWKRYRKWKHTLVLPLGLLALVLMRGETDDSARWTVALTLGALLLTAYLATETVWIHWHPIGSKKPA
jgi:hypothetical protein